MLGSCGIGPPIIVILGCLLLTLGKWWHLQGDRGQCGTFAEETTIPNHYPSRLCFHEVATVMTDISDDTIDVPVFSVRILDCHHGPNSKVR